MRTPLLTRRTLRAATLRVALAATVLAGAIAVACSDTGSVTPPSASPTSSAPGSLGGTGAGAPDVETSRPGGSYSVVAIVDLRGASASRGGSAAPEQSVSGLRLEGTTDEHGTIVRARFGRADGRPIETAIRVAVAKSEAASAGPRRQDFADAAGQRSAIVHYPGRNGEPSGLVELLVDGRVVARTRSVWRDGGDRWILEEQTNEIYRDGRTISRAVLTVRGIERAPVTAADASPLSPITLEGRGPDGGGSPFGGGAPTLADEEANCFWQGIGLALEWAAVVIVCEVPNLGCFWGIYELVKDINEFVASCPMW